MLYSILMCIACHCSHGILCRPGSLKLLAQALVRVSDQYSKYVVMEHEKKTKKHAERTLQKKIKNNSVAGTRTRVSRVRAEYPDQLDYNGS
jgi:hypothetical protein